MGMYNGCCCNKVVFSGSSNASQAVGVNGTLTFVKNVSSGVDIASNSVTIHRPGIYLVNVSASGATTDAAGDVSIQIQNNGVPINGGYSATANSTAATDIVNLSTTGIVVVNQTNCSLNDQSATISVANTGVAATFSGMAITIVRL